MWDKPRPSRHDDPDPAPSHDDIAARAYLIYLQRGGHDGDGGHDEDWHLAETQLRAERAAVDDNPETR